MEPSEESLDSRAGDSQADQIRSYLAFARYSVRKLWVAFAAVLGVGVLLTVAALAYLPRTFSCSTVLMAVGNRVLDGTEGNNALAGAADLIDRHENLEEIIRDIGLVQKFESRRPPLLHLKDRLVRAVSGRISDTAQIAALVGTLETRITVTIENGDLTVKAEWTDAHTATELAEAARESFVKARHTAEISAFDEKMTILDGHATKLREEIGVLAQQLKAVRDQKLSEVRAEQSQNSKASAAATVAQEQVVRPVVRHAVEPDDQTPELKQKLETLQTQLTATEADRDRRLREEQAKFDDLKLRLTANHPEVVTEGEKVAMLSQVPSEVALMRAEVKDLQAEIQQREGFARQGNESFTGTALRQPGGAVADPLPPDITDLLQRDNLDPGLTAQLSSTVMKYSSLRSDLLTTRIELDTAEAAFNHRYQVIIPAELPIKPEKPKPALILCGGLILSLLFSVVLPVLVELRRGVIIERWQVQHLELPILAELRLPPYSPD